MNREKKEEYLDLFAKRIKLNKLEEHKWFPKYFTIETCNNCNAKCIMCPKGAKGTSKMEMMENETYSKIVSELEQYNSWIEMICLNSDGEPTLDKQIAQRVGMLKNIGIKHVNISTNGQLLDEKLAEQLIINGLDDIRISIDAIHPETFNKIRKGLDFDKVMNNVNNLIKMRNELNPNMEIRIRMVELEENRSERTEWIDYWKSILKDSDRAQIMPMHSWSGSIVEEEESKVELWSDRPCISPFSSFAINYDGNVQLCDSDIEQQYIIGSILDKSIKDLWNSEKMEYIREMHLSGKRNKIEICRGCDRWERKFKES